MAQETFGLRKIQYAIIWLGCSLAACKAIPLYNPDSKLEIQWLNITDGDRDATRAASCADGSPAAYYYDEAENADEDMPFIIWIGDTSLCSSSDCDELCDVDGICEEDDDFENLAEEDQQESEARCYYSRAICTSKFYNEYQSLTPLTVLREDDEVFRDYRRVFLPSCSLDWFLGDGDNTDPESPRFRGFRILEEFFQDLIVNHNLLLAKTVILGGTRGGGVSVLNHLAQIKSWLEPTQQILTIVDSAWYPFFEEFQAPVSEARFPDSISVLRERFQNNTQDFFATAKLLPACQTRWSSGPNPQPINCLFASELLREYQDMPIFVVQSQYDLVHLLSDSDLLGESVDVVDDFIDETSVGAAAASYVESYGDVVRISLDQAGAQSFGGTNQHYFYTPSCAHHGYILPSSAHQVPTTVQQLGQAGGINFRRSSEHWTKIQIAGLNLQSALQQWVLSSGTRFPVAGGNGTDGIGNDTLRIWNNVRDDECTSFLCNESCLASVVPWRLGQALQECFSFMVFAYGILLIFLFYFMFMLAYFKILAFRSMCNTFWTEHKHELVPVLANQATLKRAHSAPKDIAIDPNQEAFLSEVASSEFRKMSLMVNDLEYAAPPRSRRDKPHVILKGVNLNFKPGEVHALMGPSGSGKSTLLDILALTRDSGTVAGKHYINGVETWSAKGAFLKEWLRHNLSYVGQSDVLFPQLTVKEHLTHAAWLLLPEFMDDQARLNRVLHVVKLLELETCIDTICGDGGVSVSGGISGGQRRRVSIATQLLRMPAALLLDEPTSGLDSTNALLLVKSLHLLAHRAGVNVVMTIHQPRKEIYGFLDHLSILVKGSVIFSGHPDSAASHFNVQRGGLSNVGNEILDILSKSSESSIQGFAQRYESGPLGDMTRKGMALEVTELSQEVALTLRTVLMENALGEGRWSWTESSSASTLMWVLMSRTIQRGGFDIQRTCAVSALGGLLVGFVFFNVNTPSSRAALSYLLVSSLTLIQSTFLGDRYLGEKAMFHHERGAGTVTAWTAFLSSQFIRNAVTSTLETFCFAVPVYFLGGMNLDELIRFPVFILVMSLVALAVISQNLWIQIDRNTVRGSALLQVVFLAIGALFNGFIIRLDDLPAALSWLPYILINYWGFVGTLINDLNGVSFSCDSVNDLECTARTGDAVIRSLSYDDRDVPMCILALVGIILVFHVMGILDFYIRYVHRRGSQLKQVAGHDGINYYKPKGGGSNYNFSTPDSSPSMTASASPGGMGKTMDGMIAAADAQKSPESKAGGDRSPPGSPLALGSPGKRKAPVKNKKGGEIHFVDDDDDSSFGFNMNSNVGGLPDDDSSNPVIRTFPFKGKYLVSRQTLAMLFLVDFIATGYICADNGDPLANTMVTLTTVIFSLLYVTQFVYQIAFLVPASPDGAVDCTWGGMYDGVGVPCTIADIGLSIQLVSNLNPDMENNQFVVLFALQMVVRLCRFARVWTFWNKVTAYHRVRAEVFLQHRLEMNKAEAQGGGAGEVKKLPPPILPPRRPRISIRRAKPPAPGMQEQRFANQSQQKAPPRPPRPNGLGQLFGQTAPPPRPVRSRDTLRLGQQWQSYHHSSGSSHKKVTYSAHQQELLARLQQQQRQQLRYSQQQQQQHGGGRARGNTGASGRSRGNTGASGRTRGNTGASGRTRGNTDASGTRRRQQPNQRGGGITLDEV